jgi:hypothetical protein
MRGFHLLVLGAALGVTLAIPSPAGALPVELRDTNGTRYRINTDVDLLVANSLASGAVTDATFEKPVTVTSYFIGLTPFGWFFTTYSVQYQVDVPLRNAFAGFNGLVISGADGAALPQQLAYNPGAPLAAEDCVQKNANRQLTFQTQTFDALGLAVTRKVFVPSNAEFVRWLNIVTNTGTQPTQVGITLQGQLGSGADTKITATSTGDSIITSGDLWWTTAQVVPQGARSFQPRIGFAVQGPGATAPPRSLGIDGTGRAIATYTPTIAPGASAIVMTFTTVQGNNKQAKKTMESVVGLPANAITCMSQRELGQVVNFAPITPPQLKKAIVKLKFKKTAADTVEWKGKLTIGAGISLLGLPVTVDVGGATASFVLNKKGKANNGGGNKFAINAELKNGVTKANTVNFNFHLKGDFKAALGNFGLDDTTVQDAAVTVPVSFTAGPARYAAGQPFTYDAKLGKSGTAKAP